ncbi:MAG: hypothetical protein ACPGTU_02245 [Myxococcota bacterium]
MLLIGAVESNRYVEIDGGLLKLRFGGYTATVPINDVDSSQSTTWGRMDLSTAWAAKACSKPFHGKPVMAIRTGLR